MANELKMAKKQAIIGLLENHWAHRRIARELGVDRETVARYDRLRSSNPANPAPGSELPEGSKPAISTAGSGPPGSSKPAISTAGSEAGLISKPANPTAGWDNRSQGRSSLCAPLYEVIEHKLALGLTAQRIFQDLLVEHGFTGSYSSVKRYIRRLGEKTPLPFRRMEAEPGEEAQVDFGTGAWVIADGKKHRPHVLRITLSHSRKGYSEPVYHQTTENFLRALENAFRRFGGVPKTLVIDNLKAAVLKADWYDPELHPKLLEFAKHYHLVILPTKPYTPRHKGKIENGIKYVKSNALKGRVFNSLAEQKDFLEHWERTVADTRIHGTTKKQVQRVFEEVEKPALQPLPAEPFPFYHEGRRKVHRDAHVEVEKAYYSVPPEYLGREVWIRWDSRLIRIFNDRFEQIALHARALPGRFSTNRAHIADPKISGVERGAKWLLNKTLQIGPQSHQWAEAMLAVRGIEGVRVLQGLVALTRKHRVREIERACEKAIQANLFRLRPLRELIKRAELEPELEFEQVHEIIRPLSQYQELLNLLPLKTNEEN